MQLLTPSGYVNIDNVNIGDSLVAYDVYTGEQIINHLEAKTLWTPNMMPEEGVEAHYDVDGSWVDYLLISSSYEVFKKVHGDWKFYRINGTWDLYKDQSIWANLNVIHVSELQIGDVIYNDLDQDIIVTSIEEVEQPYWWKLDVSGDSSYIADGLSLHNASRFWVGGGSSANWNATANTNWSATSAGANNASVPTSADDVTFNGSGSTANTNSTISATITILSYTVTSAYTATSTHNADLTVAGNVTLGANYTIAGSSHLFISNTCTFTSNGKTWPNNLYCNTNTTTTLAQNLTIGGIWSTTVSPTINSSTTETLTCNGIAYFNNCTPTGGTRFIVAGGSVTSQAIFGSFRNSLDIQGNVTMSANGFPIIFSDKSVKYISGSLRTTGASFNFGGSAGISFPGIQFDNVSFTALNNAANVVLSSSIFVSGTLAGVGSVFKSGSSQIIVCGSLAPLNNSLGGDAEIVHKGGSITTGQSSAVLSPLTLDGDVTFVNNIFYYTGQFGGNQTLKYQSGANNAGVTQLFLQSPCSIDTNVLRWGSLRLGGDFTPTTTLISDLNVIGFTTSSNACTINTSSGSKISTGGLLATAAIGGTATIELTGGTWSSSNVSISTNLDLNGNVTLGSNCNYQTRTIRYISGIITTSGSLNIVGNCTGSNFDKVPLGRVVITAGTTMLLDRFFIGTPENPAVIAASTAAGQYNIRFTDDFEKISQDVNVSGCVLVRPLQLLLSNTKKLNTIKTTNVGIRYTNSSPNGFPKNTRKTPRALDIRGLGLSSDPNFVEQT